MIDESNLEIGLDAAYLAFNKSASVFLEHQSIDTEYNIELKPSMYIQCSILFDFFRGPASKLILKLCFAVWCAITGALFIFPGLRVSRMHFDALR